MKILLKIWFRVWQVLLFLILALPLLVVVIVLAADHYLTPDKTYNYTNGKRL